MITQISMPQYEKRGPCLAVGNLIIMHFYQLLMNSV